MTGAAPEQRFIHRALSGLLRGAALTGGLVLLLLMGLVCVSVFARYGLNQPILGDQELVEIGMSLVVMLAIPYCTYRGQHIRVDVLDGWLGARGQFAGDLFSRAVSIAVLGLLVHKSWSKALDAREYEDVTNMLEIPVWIPYLAITIGMGLVITVLIVQLLAQLRAGTAAYAGKPSQSALASHQNTDNRVN